MPPDTERRVVFIDRNSGGRSFKALLEAAGLSVVLHDEHFGHTTEDHEWLAQVGRSGWLLVSGDDQTTRSRLFLEQLEASRAHVFILLGLNGASREAKAGCIIDTYQRMREIAARDEPPAVWRIGRDGIARRFDFKSTLRRMRERSR